jgi:hypothetical protein
MPFLKTNGHITSKTFLQVTTPRQLRRQETPEQRPVAAFLTVTRGRALEGQTSQGHGWSTITLHGIRVVLT